MGSVYYDSPTNSTLFTTCCDAAITDRESSCPACGFEVDPSSPGSRHHVAHTHPYGNWRSNDSGDPTVIDARLRRCFTPKHPRHPDYKEATRND